MLYNYFHPAYKAGGPIQSLFNLGLLLSQKNKITVITSAYDLHRKISLDGITINQWNDNHGMFTFYLSADKRPLYLRKLFKECNPDVIYLNGLYSLRFVIYPLLIWKLKLREHVKLVIAPRGMLQDGALRIKPLKKKLFLNVFKWLGLHKDVTWHATDKQEFFDIHRIFGNESTVAVAPNIPKKPSGIMPIEKEPGKLKLVFLSVISEKKNLHLVIKWLRELELPITFDIYGPIKDKKYWAQCRRMIDVSNATITYKGEVIPDEVQVLFSKYHALILPTAGENFGHAIYECLSVGRPVIIGDKTPWTCVNDKTAGYSISLQEEDKFKTAIKKLFELNNSEYNKLCNNAHSIAMEYWNENAFAEAYAKLFGDNH